MPGSGSQRLLPSGPRTRTSRHPPRSSSMGAANANHGSVGSHRESYGACGPEVGRSVHASGMPQHSDTIRENRGPGQKTPQLIGDENRDANGNVAHGVKQTATGHPSTTLQVQGSNVLTTQGFGGSAEVAQRAISDAGASKIPRPILARNPSPLRRM